MLINQWVFLIGLNNVDKRGAKVIFPFNICIKCSIVCDAEVLKG